MDLATGKIVERENRLPTPASLYRMTDPEWMYQNLKSDLALQMYLFVLRLTHEVDWLALQRLTEWLGLEPPDRSTLESTRKSVRRTLDKYGFAATKYILGKAREFSEEMDKKLLIVLFDQYRVMRTLIESGTRYDQEIVDFLREHNFRYFDMNLVHVDDYAKFRISLDEYMKRYFIGHYSPAGNHFFAYSIKDTIVDWLDPKPITYREDVDRLVDFADYLQY
jgi:hypothetical protein